MNYSTDRAITRAVEDRLGRAGFSKRLGTAICDYTGIESLVIGLFGKWGTGKTSVINMALETIKERTCEDDNRPIILTFAPWNYSDNDTLIRIFFAEMQSIVKADKNKEFKKNVGRALKDYSDVLNAVSLIPVVGTVIAPILKTAAKVSGEMLTRSADLDKTKQVLSDELRKANRKFVVVIDDIDRLTNEQIRDIFQLVKQVGDLPNIIYILLMDRTIVCRALSSVHNCDGNEYLGKIIQIPFEIPELSMLALKELFVEKLNTLFKDSSDKITLHHNLFRLIFDNCISPYLHSVRDVNRVINVIQFRLSLFKREIAIEDLVGITALEVLNPVLYKWIASNKRSVCADIVDYNRIDRAQKNLYYYYEEQFKQLGLDSRKACLSVGSLFPKFGKDTGLLYDNALESTDDIAWTRLQNERQFNILFSVDLDKTEISEVMISSIFFNLEEKQLNDVIDNLYVEKKIGYLLNIFKTRIDELSPERSQMIASALIDVVGKYDKGQWRDFSRLYNILESSSIILKIIRKIPDLEGRYNFLSKKISGRSIPALRTISALLSNIEDDIENTKVVNDFVVEPILSLDYCKKLEKEFSENAQACFSHMNVFCINDNFHLLDTWKKFDAQSVEEFRKHVLKDRVNTIKFLCTCLNKNGENWEITKPWTVDFFQRDEIINLSKDMNNILNKLNEYEQLKFAALLFYVSNKSYQVSNTEALKAVKTWKESSTDS